MNARTQGLVLLHSSFQFPDRRLFFTRARLMLDRIELSGWDLSLKHEQEIRLDELERVEWHPTSEDAPNAVLYPNEGEPISLILPEADRWKGLLEHRLRWSAPVREPVPSAAALREVPLQDLITFSTSMG